jgi:RNA polymerase sigma-70 factor, ECF subfamily
MEEIQSHEQWKSWFQQHGARLLLCARQWTRSFGDAEDVLQEAFVRFWRHQRKVPGDPVALVLTSIRRAATDLARANQRRALRETAALEPQEPFFEPNSSDDERRQAIEDALRRLPPEQREVLVLKIWGERTFDEIGETLGVSPNTAASRYRYALASLRAGLFQGEARSHELPVRTTLP